MKQLKNMSLLIGLATLGISTANAGVYVGADVGYSRIHTGSIKYTDKNTPYAYKSSDDFGSINNDKALGSIKLGYAFDEGIRTELAFTRYGNVNNNYSLEDKNYNFNIKQNLKSNTLMANVYYDFNKSGDLQPYVMAGAGLGMNKMEVKYSENHVQNNTKNSFDYQIGAGASYKITNQWYADAGVKYAYIGKASAGDYNTVYQSAKASSVDTTIGIRYAF